MLHLLLIGVGQLSAHKFIYDDLDHIEQQFKDAGPGQIEIGEASLLRAPCPTCWMGQKKVSSRYSGKAEATGPFRRKIVETCCYLYNPPPERARTLNNASVSSASYAQFLRHSPERLSLIV